MAVYYGFNPPFKGGHQKILSRQEDQRLIKNDILQLFLTIPGERVHRPTFGTRLRSTVFEPLTDQALDELRSDLLRALSEEEPRIENVSVSLEAIPDKLLLKVVVAGTLTADPDARFLLHTLIKAPGAAT